MGTAMATAKDEDFKKEVMRLAGDEVKTCIQCGTCSASCPTAHLMNPSIRKLVKLCLEGRQKEALDNETLWLCTSCLLCTVRCPRGIRPKMVVSALKELADREKIASPGKNYDHLFSKQIADYGRISELPLISEFLLTYPQGSVQSMKLGLELLPRGKITLNREQVKRKDEVRRIMEELGK